jgi:hypothetical protein
MCNGRPSGSDGSHPRFHCRGRQPTGTGEFEQVPNVRRTVMPVAHCRAYRRLAEKLQDLTVSQSPGVRGISRDRCMAMGLPTTAKPVVSLEASPWHYGRPTSDSGHWDGDGRAAHDPQSGRESIDTVLAVHS